MHQIHGHIHNKWCIHPLFFYVRQLIFTYDFEEHCVHARGFSFIEFIVEKPQKTSTVDEMVKAKEEHDKTSTSLIVDMM